MSRCIICGKSANTLFGHPDGAKIDIPFCDDCIQSISLQWLQEKLSITITDFVNSFSGERRPLIRRAED